VAHRPRVGDPVDLARHRLGRVAVEVDDGNPGALGREPTARGGPDPRTATRDECDLAVEQPHADTPSIGTTATIMVQRRWELRMWKATVKGIVAHRVRLVLSMVAVMLGVAFVAGTYVLTDTLQHSYDGLFSQTVANVDVVVRLRGEDGPELSRERFSQQLVPRVQSVSGVDDAYGVIYGYAQFVDRHGDAVR